MQAKEIFVILCVVVCSTIARNSWQQVALTLILAATYAYSDYLTSKKVKESEDTLKRIKELEEFASSQGLRKIMGR